MPFQVSCFATRSRERPKDVVGQPLGRLPSHRPPHHRPLLSHPTHSWGSSADASLHGPEDGQPSLWQVDREKEPSVNVPHVP